MKLLPLSTPSIISRFLTRRVASGLRFQWVFCTSLSSYSPSSIPAISGGRRGKLAKANEISRLLRCGSAFLADIEQTFGANELDYGRKLYLIEELRLRCRHPADRGTNCQTPLLHITGG